jgi:hypothetical protein
MLREGLTMTRYAKPQSMLEAYDWGYSEGEGGRKLSAWPSDADIETGTGFAREFMRGLMDAQRDAHRNDMSGCQS